MKIKLSYFRFNPRAAMGFEVAFASSQMGVFLVSPQSVVNSNFRVIFCCDSRFHSFFASIFWVVIDAMIAKRDYSTVDGPQWIEVGAILTAYSPEKQSLAMWPKPLHL